MTVNEESFGFELSVGQKKKFEDIAFRVWEISTQSIFHHSCATHQQRNVTFPHVATSQVSPQIWLEIVSRSP